MKLIIHHIDKQIRRALRHLTYQMILHQGEFQEVCVEEGEDSVVVR